MIEYLSISEIAVPDDRQRQVFPEQQMLELRNSISSGKGLMQPIFVRPLAEAEGEVRFMLVAGERRFRVLSEFKKPYNFGEDEIPPGMIPAIVKSFSTELDIKEAELEENIIRLELTWQERVKAIAQLHELRSLQNPQHTVGMTAQAIDKTQHYKEDRERDIYASDAAYREVQQAIFMNSFMEDEEVLKAKSLKDATKIASRKAENVQLESLMNMQLKTPAAPEKKTEVSPLLADLGAILDKPKPKGEFFEGDVREALANVDTGSIQCVIADPPYGIGVDKHDDPTGSGLFHEYSEENFEELHEYVVEELDRICTPTAHVYLFCDIDYFPTLRGLFSNQWRVRRTPLTWYKGPKGKLADGTPQGFTRNTEWILYAYRIPEASSPRPCSKVMPDLLSYASPANKVHAAQKPVDLYQALMQMSMVPGERVLDCFAGSGTIYPAAYAAGMNPVGIELNQKFSMMCRLQMQHKSLEGLSE